MTIPIPIPTGLPLDMCVPVSLGRQVCVKTGGIIDKFGQPRDCRDATGGETPPLVSVDVTFAEKTITINPLEESEVVWKQSVWIGVETNLSAVWVGEPMSETCASYELPNVDPTAAVHTVAEQVWDTAGDIVEHQFNVSRTSSVGVILVAFVAIILAFAIVLPTPP